MLNRIGPTVCLVACIGFAVLAMTIDSTHELSVGFAMAASLILLLAGVVWLLFNQSPDQYDDFSSPNPEL